jgi:hypothetical protein
MRNKFRVTLDYDPKMWKVEDDTSSDLMAEIAKRLYQIKGADIVSVNQDDDCPN